VIHTMRFSAPISTSIFMRIRNPPSVPPIVFEPSWRLIKPMLASGAASDASYSEDDFRNGCGGRNE
jgi:hypothetical protein